MKSKYTKEHSTGYKVGGLELIAEELFRVHIQAYFVGNTTPKFLERASNTLKYM